MIHDLPDGRRIEVIPFESGIRRISVLNSDGTQIESQEFSNSELTPDNLRSRLHSIVAVNALTLSIILRDARSEAIRFIMERNIPIGSQIPTAGGRSYFEIIRYSDNVVEIRARDASNNYKISYEHIQSLWDSGREFNLNIAIEPQVQEIWGPDNIHETRWEVYCLGIVLHLRTLNRR